MVSELASVDVSSSRLGNLKIGSKYSRCGGHDGMGLMWNNREQYVNGTIIKEFEDIRTVVLTEVSAWMKYNRFVVQYYI